MLTITVGKDAIVCRLTPASRLPEGFGTVALNANVQDYWDHDQTDREYQLSYNNHYNKLNYGVNFARTRNLATRRLG
ncbi:fimbrial outer membrane usher protein [Serratia fonticola]|uniref:Fimbrial outer membrane usher protein n=1 Tax=Serratia fonticola TaxID=47917 RepID=A0A4U9UQ51_SERFO|nr:fimbrial outer membrane usher protein [Serratia fonticola]